MNTSNSNLPEDTNNIGEWRLLSEINLPRQRGADKLATELVAHIIEDLHLAAGRLGQLKQAIADATLNAMKQKNLGKAELPVSIRILASPSILEFQDEAQPVRETETPGLDQDLAQRVKQHEYPHGWGFFLIDRTMDPQTIGLEGTRHRIELYIYIEGRRSNLSNNED